ncbi:hypothetical protein NAT51_13550 [Flavobacterium amniphilum]|uniref:hypothetical protein n=1 Tax=Flavobacterium amniphilum TaxID=1834035 RepID=UPI00202A3E98|nr:hypothetical protein [Flavobacterium amniphilum]MCL9806555.1 hypothetical protein [Flavobacterium amniphilum]
MLIENKGIQTDAFYVPPFTLKKGEIIILHLFNDERSHNAEMVLKDIFTGKLKDKNVIVYTALTFVDYIFEPKFKSLFRPFNVGNYLKKNANSNSPYATKIYETDWITPKTKINWLPGTPRKQLSLFASLTKTNNIIFDLSGLDKKGAEETYMIVKEIVKKGGAAIFLDYFGDIKNDCTQYIELQWNNPELNKWIMNK